MTEQTAEHTAQPEPVSSDTAGLRQLAGELEDSREMDRVINPDVPTAPVDVSSKFRNPTDADVEKLVFDRDSWRNGWAQQLENERRQEGRSPMDAKSAGQLLAALRQTEAQAFSEEAEKQAAEVQADAAAAAQAEYEQPAEPPEIAAARQQ